MLIDHAEAQRVGIGGALDRRLAAIDDEAALVGSIITEQAFHQCGFAGAVFAEQAVHGAGRDFQRHVRQRVKAAEMLADADRLDADRLGSNQWLMAIRARKVALSLTAPNTPPCILIMCSAAAWLPASVAPQQSDSSRHSKPRSLASRIVVWTQTSVVMPVRMMLPMPSRAQDQFQVGGVEAAFAGLVDDDLAGQRRQIRNDLPARLAARQDAAAWAGIADAGADLARAPALVRRQVGQVGTVALARMDDRIARGRSAASTDAIGPIGARVSDRS